MGDSHKHIGEKFGRLTVLSIVAGGGRAEAKCICDCGNIVTKVLYRLKSGNTKSCGCLARDVVVNRNARPDNYVEFIYDVAIMYFDNGNTAVFDRTDYDLIKGARWAYSGSNSDYVRCQNGSMQKILMGEMDGFIIDHINRDKSDNRRCNLRFVTPKENSQNQPKRKGYKNKYKGVGKKGNTDYYYSICRFNGVSKSLGLFRSEEAAAHAWNKYAQGVSNTASLNNIPYSQAELDIIMQRDAVKMKRTENQSGVKHIQWHTPSSRWCISKKINGKLKHFGSFADLESAKTALDMLIKNGFNNG